MQDVIVIGAGINGLASGYELVCAGFRVTIVDTYGPAAMATGWTLAGVRQSGRDPAELPLARAAVALWANLSERLDMPTGYRQDGNLRLARTPEEARTIRTLVAEQSEHGLGISLLEGQALRQTAPSLSESILCASLCATDGYADPEAVSKAYLTAFKRLGGLFKSGVKVSGINVANGKVTGVQTSEGPLSAPWVVLAAGFQGNALLRPLGLEVPLDVHMVSVLRSIPQSRVLKEVIGVANADCAGRQEPDGRFRVTGGVAPWHGTLLEGDRPRVPTPAGTLKDIINLFAAIIPAFESALIDEIWTGLIDLTPDALPVIDMPAAAEGLMVTMGFSGHGFCLGPVVGDIVSRSIEGKPITLPLEPFRLDRFNSVGRPASKVTLHG